MANPQIIGAAIEDAGKWQSDIGNALTKSSEAESVRNAYQAYYNYLGSLAKKMQQELEARADKYDSKLQDQFNQAEPEYKRESETALPELEQLRQDILDENSETQRRNMREIYANLAAQGIRGGQAGILANRAIGETNRDALRNINQLAYNEAANRQNSRLNYYGQKALTPYQTMSSAYGTSLAGANNALSNAQGGVYRDAYDAQIQNYLGTQNMNAKGWKGWLGGINTLMGNHAQSVGRTMQGGGLGSFGGGGGSIGTSQISGAIGSQYNPSSWSTSIL